MRAICFLRCAERLFARALPPLRPASATVILITLKAKRKNNYWQAKFLLATVTALCDNASVPFVKLDTGILDSSLWSEPAQTCKCWITLLAMADATGTVHSTAPGIARRANLGLADTEKALKVFESPDGHSRSLNEEGRRIKRIDGGYQIVNYGKYRERDYTAAERQKRWRDKQKSNAVTPVTRNVTSRKQKQSTEADSRVPKHLNDVLVYAQQIGLGNKEAEKFFDYFTSNGWKVSGRAPMQDWKASLRNWQRNSFSVLGVRSTEEWKHYDKQGRRVDAGGRVMDANQIRSEDEFYENERKRNEKRLGSSNG